MKDLSIFFGKIKPKTIKPVLIALLFMVNVSCNAQAKKTVINRPIKVVVNDSNIAVSKPVFTKPIET